MRLINLGEQSFWWDEVKTIQRASWSMGEMVAEIIGKRGQHMPIYFLLMQGWGRIGLGEFVARYFSLIWGVIGVGFVYQIGRLLNGWHAGLIAAFLLAISPFHIYYSQEARMYSLVVTAVLSAHYFLFNIFFRQNEQELQDKNNTQYWIGYAVSMSIAVYTHLFSLFVLMAHYIFFVLNLRRIKPLFMRWLLATAFVVALTAVWATAVIQTGGYGESVPGWIPIVTSSDLLFTLLSFSAGRTVDPGQIVGYGITAVYLLGTLIAFRHTRQKKLLKGRLLFSWFFVPLLFTFFISLNGLIMPERAFSIYADRYLSYSLPAFILATAWGLSLLAQHNKWVLPIGLLIVTGLTAVSLNNLYFNPAYARTDWKTAVATIEAHVQPSDLLFSSQASELPLAHYETALPNFIELPPSAFEPELAEMLNDSLTNIIPAAIKDGQRAWIITIYRDNNVHGFPQGRNQFAATNDPYQKWMDTQYQPLQKWTFPGLHLALYDTN